MKLLTLLVSTFVLLSFSAQKELNATKIEAASVEKAPANTSNYSFKVDEEKLAKKNTSRNSQFKNKDASYYDSYIKALESKRDFVLTDSSMTSNAKKEGWFDFVEKQIAIAKEEKLKLDK